MKELYQRGIITVVVIGIIIGAVWLTVRVEQVRQTVHHHANILILIDGERLDISEDKYMEDIGACKAGSQKSPADRVHFHENNMDIVHVHDDGVTWGHFLANLGFYATRGVIVLDDGTQIAANTTKSWRYMLNGKEVLRPFNAEIFSEDRLLLSYGDATKAELEAQYATVSANAGEYNAKYDPGSCQTNVKQNFLVKTIAEMLGAGMDHSAHE